MCTLEAGFSIMEKERDSFDAANAAEAPIDIVEVGMERIDTIRRLNVVIFEDRHIIETFDHEDLLMLLAERAGTAVGFKVGYQLDETTFYSAKGGVHPSHRRRGIARALLHAMLTVAKEREYERFVYDTFPNKHPGMTVLGLDEGFEVIRAGYSTRYQDYRLRFERHLNEG